MESHIVLDGNAFYEIDDDCLKKQQDEKAEKEAGRDGGTMAAVKKRPDQKSKVSRGQRK